MQRHYYQDLPFYLQQRVILSQCSSELNFGRDLETKKGWFINLNKFLEKWKGKKRVFALSRFTDYQHLLQHSRRIKTYIIGRTKRHVLFSNRP